MNLTIDGTLQLPLRAPARYQAGGGWGGQGKHLGIGSFDWIITLNAGVASIRTNRIFLSIGWTPLENSS